METIRIPRIMADTSNRHIMRGRRIGFVATMGALHAGHLSLIRRSKDENDVTAVSIFVNPTQFGPSEDFNKYPRDIESDTAKLLEEEVDILFLPDASIMYPPGFRTHIEVEGLSDGLCGAFRPGHFRGVATVVLKLFHIVKPARAYFGQKDFQQTVVIRRLVKDLNMEIEIVVCPTIREKDGLAMSSRNGYLDADERIAASVIFKSLTEAAAQIRSGIIDTEHIRKVVIEKIVTERKVTEVEYAGVYDPETLEEQLRIGGDALIAVAVKIGGIRLIDNIFVAEREVA